MNAIRTEDQLPIPFAGGNLDQYRHVCAFFDSPDEEQFVMTPFIRDGLERGEKAFHVVDPDQRTDYVRRLEDSGIAVSAAEEGGQFEIRTWDETFFRTGQFDQEAMLALIDKVLKGGTPQDFPLTRFVGHPARPQEGRLGVDELVEFESRVNYIVIHTRHLPMRSPSPRS
jgi:hypothetical protein